MKKTPRLYDKVETPLSEQGYVHAVRADGVITVKLIDPSLEQLTVQQAWLRDYSVDTVSNLKVITAAPAVNDLTPFGIVKSVVPVIEGIARVLMRDNTQMLWLSEKRLTHLPTDYADPKSHWAEIEDTEYLLAHYGYTESACRATELTERQQDLHSRINRLCDMSVELEGLVQKWTDPSGDRRTVIEKKEAAYQTLFCDTVRKFG